MSLLDGLNAHPFLKPRIALKGGTALNLFVFDVPRLSVDIDLNYIGAAARETMLDERPKVEQAVRAVCSRDGLPIKRMPSEHAGGKWRLAYTRSTGDSGNLELDVNFMLRVPLWEPVFLPSVGRWDLSVPRLRVCSSRTSWPPASSPHCSPAAPAETSSTRAARTRGLRSGRHRREPGLAVGNVVGSNIFNIGAILGLVECGVVVIAGAVVRHRGGCRHRAAADRAGRAAHHRTC